MLDEIAADALVPRTMITREAAGGGALACRNIAARASERAPNTALYYAWAAAAVSPQSASLAREVASYARQVSDSPLAESWLRRAIALARSEGGWATYGRAHCDLCQFLSGHQQHIHARSAFVRTLRVSRRHGLPRALRARALLGLLRVALTDNLPANADQLQRRLLRLYAVGHPEALRTRLAVARALVDHGNLAAADAYPVPPGRAPEPGTSDDHEHSREVPTDWTVAQAAPRGPEHGRSKYAPLWSMAAQI